MNQLPWYVIGAVSQTVTRVYGESDREWERKKHSCRWRIQVHKKQSCQYVTMFISGGFLSFVLVEYFHLFIFFFFCTQFMSVTVFHIWFGSVFRKAFQWATSLQEFLLILTTLVSRIATSITFQFNQDRLVSEWMKSEKSRLLYIFTVTQHIQ